MNRTMVHTAGSALLSVLVAGCATPLRPPEISYDRSVPTLPPPPAVAVADSARPLHVPPGWVVAKGGAAGSRSLERVENANAAARVEPRREGYYNAIQVYPWSDGALYQVYAAPGQITNISLEPGETLAGEGPIAAGDTARWIIGDTQSGNGDTRRVHILVKPTRPDLATNLVVTTDRRVYMIELRSGAGAYMPAVAWAYPRQPAGPGHLVAAAPAIPAVATRNHRYRITGGNPPWKPVDVFDDGRKVYVEFPRGIVQGEMPPLFVIGPDGEAQLVNSRVHQHILIVDRLFSAAELRLGSGRRQEVVRIVRSDARKKSDTWSWTARNGDQHS